MIARLQLALLAIALLLALACIGSPLTNTPQQPTRISAATLVPSPTPDVPATVEAVEAGVARDMAAIPTDTPIPTPTQTPQPPNAAFGPALEGEWVAWVEDDSWTLCFEHEGQEAALFHMEFELEPDATIGGGAYLPLTLLAMNAPEDGTLQYWFTPVPESSQEGQGDRIDTPDNIVVPSGFTVEHPHYSFRAGVTADQVANLWEAIQEESLLLAVHGSVPGFEGSTIIGFGYVPFCGYTMNGRILELPKTE